MGYLYREVGGVLRDRQRQVNVPELQAAIDRLLKRVRQSLYTAF